MRRKAKADPENAMTPFERRASASLAGIYGLRMLGLFIILPIFAIYAQGLPGGQSHFLIGIALGAYGLTQSVLQIPMGMLSDRFGRKPVILVGLIIFAIGSFVAADAHNIYWIIIGRVIQGAGAINAAVMALTADLTREEHRTKAMATIGMTIGITFSISLVLSPILYHWIGVPGIFALTGVLSLLGLFVVGFVVPKPAISRFHSDTEASLSKIGGVLRNPDLLRLDIGIFSLHAILMSVFMQVPFVLRDDGLPAQHHWMIYLPVMLIAFVLMVPPIISAEKKAKMKQVFMGAVALAHHGIPRYTGDLDVLVRNSPENARRLELALTGFGLSALGLKAADFVDSYRVIQLGVAPFRIDILTSLTGVSFDQAWANRVETVVGETRVNFLGRNELIRSKKLTGRAQDRADLEALGEEMGS